MAEPTAEYRVMPHAALGMARPGRLAEPVDARNLRCVLRKAVGVCARQGNRRTSGETRTRRDWPWDCPSWTCKVVLAAANSDDQGFDEHEVQSGPKTNRRGL